MTPDEDKRVPFKWKQRAHYIIEIQELIASLIIRLGTLDEASKEWLEHHVEADKRIALGDDLDMEQFQRATRAILESQAVFFDNIEGFLAGWARLSLLLFSDVKGFPAERSAALRAELGVKDDSPLSDRELRNHWMHFDERMDAATQNGTFHDRQRFIRSRQTPDFIKGVLRLMELDTQVIHVRNRKGTTDAIDLRRLRSAIEELKEGAAAWWRVPSNAPSRK